MEQNNNSKNQTLPLHKLEQFITNVRVLEELAKSNPEREILKQYKGFGGLRNCFWDKQLYGQVMRAIRANFGTEQEKTILEHLRQSTKSAYYTPKEIIKFMYRYLEQVCEFTGGDILEPSCGNGAFFEYMPEHIKANSNLTGVEYDILTSKLVKGIYPEVEIINNGLQSIDFSGRKYDLIIGNPPYSGEKITDDFMPELNGYTIHHYFTAKCMRLLKDNGILAFVLPSFYMDIPRNNTRHIINGESVIIDVIRLPENMFEQATVTVDILLLRKTGNKIHEITNTVTHKQGEASDQINEFWVKNPNRILGKLKLKWVKSYNRFVPTCEIDDRTKILQYLESCQFDNNTIENYQKIIATATNQTQKNQAKPKAINDELLVISKTEYTNLLASISEVFIEVEELESLSKKLQQRLESLHPKVWAVVEEFEEKINIAS
ncbi:MAG: SAM-dependent methyltransferase [Burkholderiales bacterium]|nr:SAM-dependent methyltransferase [Burkholderiales bacterium]